MKKIVSLFTSLCLILISNTMVFAETKNILVQPVKSIEQVQYPSMTDNVYMSSTHTNRAFYVSSPGEVKIVVRTDRTNRTGRMWVSTDIQGLNIIGDMTNIQQIGSAGSNNVGIAGAEMIRYLESGNYYLNFNGDQESGNVQVAILHQETKESGTWLESGNPQKGFLSEMAVKDTYSFRVDEERANVTITVSKDMASALLVELKNQSNAHIEEKMSSSNEREVKKIYLLKKGNYKLDLTANGSYGETSTLLNVEPVYLDATVSTKVAKTATIKVRSSNFVTLMWAKGRQGMNSFEDSNIWTSEYVIDENGKQVYIDHNIKNGAFTVKENGYYTIKMQDEMGNKLLKVIKVSNIDRTAPKINVKNGKAYKVGYTIKINDKSGLKSITLNGKKTKSTYKIVKAGVYTIKAVDKVGNVISVKIKIK